MLYKLYHIHKYSIYLYIPTIKTNSYLIIMKMLDKIKGIKKPFQIVKY